ncbi:MAG: hypothetical protein HY245_13070 [Rhizobiales bacterium]|nr:hypothetical protein [Hyphomicrobiales bacterium]
MELLATSCDAQDFLRLAVSTAREELRQAVALWTGELLADAGIADRAFSDWLAGERRRFGDFLQQAIDRLLPLEQGEERISLAKKLVVLDPLREASHLALMQAFVAAGERSQALAHYATARDLLKAELGVAPGNELEALRANLLSGGETPAPLARPEAAASAKPTIAVLPFVNLSGDPARQYLSDGLTEDLIIQLARYTELSVLSRTTAVRLSAEAGSLGAARVLGAQFVVKGAARAGDSRLIVSCQLLEGATGNVVWGERYDRQTADIFGVLDEVVVRIVTALGRKLVSAGASSANRKPTTSWSAHDYFLPGAASAFSASSGGRDNGITWSRPRPVPNAPSSSMPTKPWPTMPPVPRLTIWASVAGRPITFSGPSNSTPWK